MTRRAPQPHQPLSDELRRLANVITRTVDANGRRPSPGSKAHAEWAEGLYGDPAWSDSPAESLDIQSVLSLSAAVDHALGLADLMGRRQAASLTVSRGGLEAAAWARWLAAPEVLVAERVRRQVNEVLYGVFEQARALVAYGDVTEAEDDRARLDRILTRASRHPEWGVPIEADTKWRKEAYIGTRRPSVMNLIDLLLKPDDGARFGSHVYRVSSAVAHTSPHGFLIAGSVRPSADGGYQVFDSNPWAQDRWATLHLPAVAGLFNAALVVFARLEWETASLKETARGALGRWMEAAHPGSADALVI